MTDYRRAVNAPQQSLGAVTLRDRSFTNTNTVDFLSNVKPPQLFRKWLPRAWNRHCESHVTLPCLLVIEPRGEGAGAAPASHAPRSPAPCEEGGWAWAGWVLGALPLYLLQEMLHPTRAVVSLSVGLSGTGDGWLRGGSVSFRGRVWGGRLRGKGVLGAACGIPRVAGGASETGMLAGSPSAWVPKMPSGNQESAGVSPANAPDEARGSQSQEWTCWWGRIPIPTAPGVSLHFWPRSGDSMACPGCSVPT